MKIKFKPNTKFGKWSVWLILSFFAFLGIFFFFVNLGLRGGDTFFSNPTLAIPISLAGLGGVASLVTGLFAVIKDKERSVPVFISVLLGAFVLYWILAEILFPH